MKAVAAALRVKPDRGNDRPGGRRGSRSTRPSSPS